MSQNPNVNQNPYLDINITEPNFDLKIPKIISSKKIDDKSYRNFENNEFKNWKNSKIKKKTKKKKKN